MLSIDPTPDLTNPSPTSLLKKKNCICLVSFFFFAGNYLVVITKKVKVGEFFNHAIWRATDFDVLSYKKTMLHLTDIQVRI